MKNYLSHLFENESKRFYGLEIQNFADEDIEDDNEDIDNNDSDKGNPKGNDENQITLSKRNLSMRLEKERNRERKKVAEEYEKIIQQKVNEALSQYLDKDSNSNATNLSQISEGERKDRELKKLREELEKQKQEIEDEKKKILIAKKENELIKAFREEKLPNSEKFNDIAKVLAKLEDEDRNSIYLDLVDFIRESIDAGVEERFKVQSPRQSSKLTSDVDKETDVAIKYAKNGDGYAGKKASDFSRWGK